MSEKLVKLLQEQLEEQRKQATEQLEEQRKQHKEQLELIMTVLKGTGSAVSNAYVPPPSVAASVPPPSFSAFDSTAELWTDSWARFTAFAGAHSLPADNHAQVFLITSLQ